MHMQESLRLNRTDYFARMCLRTLKSQNRRERILKAICGRLQAGYRMNRLHKVRTTVVFVVQFVDEVVREWGIV